MKRNGYKQYDSVLNTEYRVPDTRVYKRKEVDSPMDKILNLIFSTDKHGVPQSSVQVMLSSKTSDDVRSFIQQNLIIDKSDPHLINDPKIVSEFEKLSSEFIAECSRNRYESIEHYEKRLQDLISDGEKANLIRRFHEGLNKMKSDLK